MFVMLIDTFRMVFILPDSLFVFVVGAGSVLTGVIDKIRIFDKVHRQNNSLNIFYLIYNKFYSTELKPTQPKPSSNTHHILFLLFLFLIDLFSHTLEWMRENVYYAYFSDEKSIICLNDYFFFTMQKTKSKHQIKALFFKNLHLQKRQPCTNCCQIFTPIICLLLTIVIRNVAIENIPTVNDTIYGIEPLFPFKFNDYDFVDGLDEYVRREKAQFFVFDCDRQQDRKFVGLHDGHSFNNYSGLLGTIPATYPQYEYYDISIPQHQEYLVPPVFRKANTSIQEELFNRYEYLNNETFDSLRHTRTAQKLPDGAINFKIANQTHLNALLRIKDVRELLFYRPNGITQFRFKIDVNSTRYNAYFIISEGFLSLMHMISASYIKLTTGKTIVSGYAYLPLNSQSSVFIEMLINTVATIIFPLSLSLLLPVFLYLIVLQKQEKLIQMMRMNGMSILNYWAINFLYNLIISILTNIVFYLFGYIFLANSFFRQVNPMILFVIMFGWILSQIGLSMLLQVFLSSSRAANIIGYLVSIWTNLIGATLSVALFQYPVQLPVAFRLMPTFSFNRLFYLLFTNCSMDKCPTSFSSLTDEMVSCITVLYVSSLVFALIGMYLFQVIPQEYGVNQSILFPIYYFTDKLKSKENSIQDMQGSTQQTANDFTIQEEKSNIKGLENISGYPLICNNLTKKYKNGKLAVENFNLIVEDNSIFGLLGPNGAGKTTLLSMITGIFSPSSGQAFVGGYSILNEIDKVHLEMGVCPQFDILWPTLTVEQHLYFYARLRGISGRDQRMKVQEALEEVNLVEQRNFKVDQLSGGMKRRLSIGISLVGDPRIVFMDEPTSGLDPENRRHLWQVLARCGQRRSLFITTHLMEEAESLCDKIGIITEGKIRTIGNQFKLKQIYGKGYFISVSLQLQKKSLHQGLINDDEYNDVRVNNHISIMTENVNEEANKNKKNVQKLQKLKMKLLNIFRPATICKEIGGLIKINVASAKVSQILENLQMMKESDFTFDWSISESTIEDVFLQVIMRFNDEKKGSLLQQQEV